MAFEVYTAEEKSTTHKIRIGGKSLLTGEVRNKVDKIWTDIWAGVTRTCYLE